MSEPQLDALHRALHDAFFDSEYHRLHKEQYTIPEADDAIRDVFMRHRHELNLGYVKTLQGREHAVEDIVSVIGWNRQKNALQRHWSGP